MKSLVLSITIILLTIAVNAQLLYEMPKENLQTRWFSFENPTGEKGKAAHTNNGAKGSAWKYIQPGQTLTLVNVKGSGSIQRVWLTLKNRSATMLHSLIINMYWDDSRVPAVSASVADFFGAGLGKIIPFENALFSSPEGRSFNCYIPMPFKKSARVTITNKSNKENTLFYDVNLLHGNFLPNSLYFHTFCNTSKSTQQLGKDFEILPKIYGKGRFLGCHINVVTDSSYKKTWWGEGVVKIYLDGDAKYPTLAGTGTEDYIGTGYGQGVFIHQYQGCTIANKEKGEWSFYRYHIPDPVYFYKNCRVTIRQMGGAAAKDVKAIYQAGAALIPVSSGSINFFEMPHPPKLTDADFPDEWTNFYRLDAYSSTAYFYVNKP